MSQQFDVVVIGGGPGGYTAAIRAAQLGFKTACIEKWRDPADNSICLGGTCLNVGCIPSKALLESSEHYAHAHHELSKHGVMGGDKLTLDLSVMMKRRATIVKEGTQGIQYLFRKNKVTLIEGKARCESRTDALVTLHVEGAKDPVVTARYVILATGSVPRSIPGVSIDNDCILDNEGALSLSSVPGTLGIIGAGVIGLEMGQVWSRLGAQVTLLEGMPSFLAAADTAVSKEVYKQLTAKGLKIHLNVQVAAVKKQAKGVLVEMSDGTNMSFERLIVAVGRVPYTDGLALDRVGVTLDERGYIRVNEACQTAASNIYAIGDVVRGPMLAHKAAEEGVCVAEVLAGQKPHLDFNTVPWVIYTQPEIAWVGKTEQACQAEKREVRIGVCSFIGNGRAKCIGQNVGFVKMIACAKTDEILGVHIVGPWASELITECVVAMEFQATAEDIARIIHAHPSLSETVHEAALAVDKRPINA